MLILQSVLLGNLIDYFSIEVPSSTDTHNTYIYAAGLVLVSIILVPAGSLFFHIGRVMEMKIRGTLLAAIYQKV